MGTPREEEIRTLAKQLLVASVAANTLEHSRVERETAEAYDTALCIVEQLDLARRVSKDESQ